MEGLQFAQLASAFVAKPDPERAAQLIAGCRPFVIKQAYSWQNTGMNMFERIREVMAEMFLILLEDVRPEQSKDDISLLSYLGLKLRRLTRPRRHKAFAFGLGNDMEDLGRYNFSPLRLQLTAEIVAAIRKTLAAQHERQTGLLEMLFIHLYPEITWASHNLARFFAEDAETRHAADRKRHLVFNQKLRQAFNQLPSADWREIRDWSSGERSYLAGRIIDFVPAELNSHLDDELQLFEKWRQRFDKHAPVAQEQMQATTAIFRALQNSWGLGEDHEERLVAEDACTYGEEPDLLGLLLARAKDNEVRESASTYDLPPDLQQAKIQEDKEDLHAAKIAADPEFNQAAEEINAWLKTLLKASTFSPDRT